MYLSPRLRGRKQKLAFGFGQVLSFCKRGAKKLPHRETPNAHRNFAKQMRREPTRAENMLWQALRARKLGGMKFKRQVPMENYILDFICSEKRVIVEVDGGQHAESNSDMVRDAHFAK